MSLSHLIQHTLRRSAQSCMDDENIRRIEKEGRMLPSPIPPDGWDIDDGYPD